jgi:ribosomal protein S6
MFRSKLSFHVQLRHAAIVAAAASSLAVASFALAWPAAAQTGSMSQRQIMKMLGPMMQDANFDEELEDFAEEHNLDPNMLRAMVAKQMGRKSGRMSQRQIMKMLGPMMQDPDFNEKLEDFADEHNLDPNVLRAMVAKQKGGKGARMSQRQIMKMLGPMMQDANFDEELEDFAEEHSLDPNMLRAMVAKQKGAGGMTKQMMQQ